MQADLRQAPARQGSERDGSAALANREDIIAAAGDEAVDFNGSVVVDGKLNPGLSARRGCRGRDAGPDETDKVVADNTMRVWSPSPRLAIPA